MTNEKKVNPILKYIFNNLVSLDQGLNTIAGGDEDETISSRLGKIKDANGGKIPWYRPVAQILEWGLDTIQKDHCEKAIEADEGKDAVLDQYAEHHWHDSNKGGK